MASEAENDLATGGRLEPLVSHLYTADPSARVFDGVLYVYPSHDIDAGVPEQDTGEHFAMEDYHVLSLDHPQAPAVDHGQALHVRDVPWAERQMWAPDAAEKRSEEHTSELQSRQYLVCRLLLEK